MAALLTLVPHLPIAGCQTRSTSSRRMHSARVWCLSWLSWRCEPQKILDRTLSLSRRLPPAGRAQALAQLASRFPTDRHDDVVREALDAALETHHATWRKEVETRRPLHSMGPKRNVRSHCLVRLAPHLMPELLDDALVRRAPIKTRQQGQRRSPRWRCGRKPPAKPCWPRPWR